MRLGAKMLRAAGAPGATRAAYREALCAPTRTWPPARRLRAGASETLVVTWASGPCARAGGSCHGRVTSSQTCSSRMLFDKTNPAWRGVRGRNTCGIECAKRSHRGKVAAKPCKSNGLCSRRAWHEHPSRQAGDGAIRARNEATAGVQNELTAGEKTKRPSRGAKPPGEKRSHGAVKTKPRWQAERSHLRAKRCGGDGKTNPPKHRRRHRRPG